jgi:ribosomal protein RSM22 (predicted rRNA methylase)
MRQRCGGRRVLAQWPHLDSLALHDRSPLARRFAAQRARVEHPRVTICETSDVGPDTLLVISHVLNELSTSELPSLLALARQAQEIIWVEAGTHVDSRRLITEVREALLPEFAVVAPCTHQARCGMLARRTRRIGATISRQCRRRSSRTRDGPNSRANSVSICAHCLTVFWCSNVA